MFKMHLFASLVTIKQWLWLGFLSVLEREISGENLIPHLSSSIRKIVPGTRASARPGIAILLILKLRGEQIIPYRVRRH